MRAYRYIVITGFAVAAAVMMHPVSALLATFIIGIPLMVIVSVIGVAEVAAPFVWALAFVVLGLSFSLLFSAIYFVATRRPRQMA